jgi:anti-sigma-K factor RskA
MLNAGADLTTALRELDPGSRALLDLSLRRGVRDEELAELLKTDTGEVERRRAEAIETVAAEVGRSDPGELPTVRSELAELPPDSWNGGGTARSAPVEAETSRLSPRRMLIAALPIAAIAAIVAGLVAAGAYHGGDEASPRKAPVAPKAPAPSGQRVALAPVGATAARGTARLAGRGRRTRLKLSLSGLAPDARHEAWLYDSIADAVPVGAFRGPSARVRARLPAGAGRYRYLDVSLEPSDGNPSHSGQSVLRIPLSKLR